MILVDELRPGALGDPWCRMGSDTSLSELHAFAVRLGLKRHWFRGGRYELRAAQRRKAVAAGVVEVDAGELERRAVGAGKDRIAALARELA